MYNNQRQLWAQPLGFYIGDAIFFPSLTFKIGMLYASKLFHTWLEEIEKRCGQFSPPLYIILTRNIVSAIIALSQLVSSTIYILCFLQMHNFIWYALITSLPVDVNGLLMRKLPHWAGFCNRGRVAVMKLFILLLHLYSNPTIHSADKAI